MPDEPEPALRRDLPIGIEATGERPESDSMGTIGVPADRYWGAQTQRSLTHFAIGGDRMPALIPVALGYVKKAAAQKAPAKTTPANAASAKTTAAKTTAAKKAPATKTTAAPASTPPAAQKAAPPPSPAREAAINARVDSDSSAPVHDYRLPISLALAAAGLVALVWTKLHRN